MEGHPIAEHNNRFERIDRAIEAIQEKLSKGGERIAEVEASTKGAHKRLSDREEEFKTIREIAYSVRTIADEMGEMKCELKDMRINHGDRITNMERKAGDTAIKLWHVFLAAVIAALGGMAATSFFMSLKP